MGYRRARSGARLPRRAATPTTAQRATRPADNKGGAANSAAEWYDLRSLGPTMNVEQAAALLGISRTTAYAEAERFRSSQGQRGLPNIKLGDRVLVLTAALAALLALESPFTPEA